MGQVEVNNAFLLGMASKGVIRVREVVENGGLGLGGLAAYEDVTGMAVYGSVPVNLAAYEDVTGMAVYGSVPVNLAAYEDVTE